MNDIERGFLVELSKLPPTEFIGVMKYLGVAITTAPGSAEPRDAIEMIGDALESFKKKNRLQRRKILKLMRECGRKGDD